MTTIIISPDRFRELRDHLLLGQDEQAAFAFADWNPRTGFQVRAIDTVLPHEFAFQSPYHIELSSEKQARVIKRAFDLSACLIEFHSHRSRGPAQFSPSDFSGFEAFVPHVRWRLRGRPYGAVVFHESSVDGLAWIDAEAVQVDALEAGQLGRYVGTRLSLRAAKDFYDK